MQFAYDTYGRRFKVIYQSGRQVEHLFDAAGRISELRLNEQTLVGAITYHPFGAPKSWVYGNSTAFARTFDLDGRIATYPKGTGTRTLTYDAASRVTGFSDTNPALTQTFAYDNLDRLTTWVGLGANQAYQYDLAGNRTTHTVSSTNYGYTLATNSNRLSSIAGPTVKSYTYDSAGNRSSAGTIAYPHAADGRLVLR